MKQFILSILILTSTSLYAQCEGDLNGDGIKNVVDIVALVNQVLSGDTECEEQSVHGCLDSQACNYDASALIDNNSCYYCYDDDCDTYPGNLFDCDGVCLLTIDCAGACGGNAMVDDCGVCDDINGWNSSCVQDCTGEWGGSSIIDECGICGGDNSTCSSNEFIHIYEIGDGSSESPKYLNLTSDNGYIVTGVTSMWQDFGNCPINSHRKGYLLKTNSNGIEEWTKKILSETCAPNHSSFYTEESNDGNFLVTGVGYDMWGDFYSYILKIDENGNDVWMTYIDDMSGEPIGIETSDGGYIVIGGYPTNNGDLFIVKFDENRNEIWSQIYSQPYTDEAKSIKETDDGGYILVGLYGYQLMKIDSLGNLVWNNPEVPGNHVNITNDGGFIVSGSNNTIYKVDSVGTIQWEESSSSCYYAIQTNDNGYICTGNVNNSIGLYKFNNSGDLDWDTTIENPNESVYGRIVKQANDGGYIILAQNYSGNTIIVKTDSQGNTVDWPE
tara:strand:- start:373 stop:1869 length:1497 start_codon:yes stop_codon:yes gene_type:complete